MSNIALDARNIEETISKLYLNIIDSGKSLFNSNLRTLQVSRF